MTAKEAMEIRNSNNAGQIYDKKIAWKELSAVIDDALEKQIPQKPEKVGNLLFCPRCGSTYVTRFPDTEMNYCNNCGQRIEWGGIG